MSPSTLFLRHCAHVYTSCTRFVHTYVRMCRQSSILFKCWCVSVYTTCVHLIIYSPGAFAIKVAAICLLWAVYTMQLITCLPRWSAQRHWLPCLWPLYVGSAILRTDHVSSWKAPSWLLIILFQHIVIFTPSVAIIIHLYKDKIGV